MAVKRAYTDKEIDAIRLARWRCRTDLGYLCREVLGYTLAAVGVYSQISSGFNIGFPLNLVFMPLTIVEWFLRYQIASTAAG